MAFSRANGNEVAERPPDSKKAAIRILSAVTILGILMGVAGLLLPRAASYATSDSVSDRKAVVAATTDFAVAYNTYDVAEAGEYQHRLKGLLTSSYDKEFVKITDSIFKLLVDKKQVSDNAKVLGVAVDSIDKDSAIALVAVDASLTNTDSKAAVARHLRWRVNLVKQRGRWLVDKFESVATAGATTAAPSAAPTEPSADGSVSK